MIVDDLDVAKHRTTKVCMMLKRTENCQRGRGEVQICKRKIAYPRLSVEGSVTFYTSLRITDKFSGKACK